jgi:WD40 repeat protein
VLSLAISPDGQQMLTSSASMAPDHVQGGLILWDVETGQIVRQLTTESTGQVVFSADGSRAVTGTYWGSDGHISLWDVTTGQEIRRFEHGHGPGDAAFCVAFGPDGTTIISGSADSTLIEWDIETGQIRRRFVGHDGAIWSHIRLSQDGRYMLSASFGDVILWDFTTGGILHHFRGYTNWGNVMFGPNEQTAFSASGSASDGIIEWKSADMPLDELVRWTYANRYIRELTCEERAQYRVEPVCK